MKPYLVFPLPTTEICCPLNKKIHGTSYHCASYDSDYGSNNGTQEIRPISVDKRSSLQTAFLRPVIIPQAFLLARAVQKTTIAMIEAGIPKNTIQNSLASPV